jgi:proline dehydrogenase
VSGPLFQAPVLWLANSPLVRRVVGAGPGRRLALRFVAGETLDDGVRVARGLNERGVGAMLDHLGENVDSADQASAAADGYVLALKRLQEEGLENVNISVKLTQLGLDVSEETCLENSHRVLEAAQERGTVVMIDMESFGYVDRTLSIYRSLRRDHPDVGVCVQAYLYRSAEDVRALAAEGATVRVCKGAYLEGPAVAFPRKAEVNGNYARLAATLLAAGCTVHIATHDQQLIEGALRFVERRGIPSHRFEFQMLYGIRRDLQNRLVRAGFPLRVYVPYGSQWYPYLTRRLAERPANVWFLASNLVRRGG